jgi:hypothetical protein
VLAQSLFGQGKDLGSALADIEHLDAGEAERAMTAELRAWGLLWVGEGRPAEAEAPLLEAEGSIKDPALGDELRAARATVLFFSGQLARAMALPTSSSGPAQEAGLRGGRPRRRQLPGRSRSWG